MRNVLGEFRQQSLICFRNTLFRQIFSVEQDQLFVVERLNASL